MREPALLADYLDQRSDAILAHWRETVERRGDVPEAGRLNRSEFNDHVPLLLDRLAERLRGLPVDSCEVGRRHGEHRWRQGYDVAEIVNELGHLRATLSEATFAFARQHRWDQELLGTALAAIHQVLDGAMAESVRQFQEDSRRETHEALAEVKRRQQAVEDAWVSAQLDKAKLRAILRSLPLAVWVADTDGTIIGSNDQAERMRVEAPIAPALGGVATPPVEGQGFHSPDGRPYPPDSLPLLRALRGEIVTEEDLVWEGGGDPVIIAVNAAPLTDSEGRLLGAVAVVWDVTERQRLTAELAASEARFRAIAEKSPVMIWRTDSHGLCDYVNQTWCEFRGLGPELHMGEAWSEGIHPDDRGTALLAFREALRDRRPLETSYRLRRHDGQYRWVNDLARPFYDPQGQFLGYLCCALDITARIEQEAVHERQRVLAEEASVHKTRLVSALSHDARTPLNAVVLAAQLLELHLDSAADGEVRECLRTIRHSVRNVLDLLGDLLNLSRIDAGALPAEVTRFPAEPVLAECLSSVENQARAKGLDVRLEPGPLAGCSLETDRPKLKQILCNLLSNALRYTESGHIRVVCDGTAEAVSISVEDTGIGIAEADQSRIFDEFAMIESARRKPGEGTGLGLAISLRLAHLLKGEIRLRSEVGAGSRFTLVLPRSVLTLTTPDPGGRQDYDRFSPAGAGAILVAEDHQDSRRTLAKVLRRMGYRVLEADNGQGALELARAEPHLRAVLMDVNMPVMDGVEATLALRADPRLKDVPVFALTGDVTPLNQQRIGEAGVNGYLEKPVTWDSLREALDSVGDTSRRWAGRDSRPTA